MKKVLFIGLILSLVFLGFGLPGCPKKDKGIWRSEDGGETWSQQVKVDKKHTISSLNVLKLTFDPRDPQRIFSGTEKEGMYLSENGGDDWQRTAISQGDVWDMAIDPDDSKIIYVSVFDNNLGRVYFTADGGENWEAVFVDALVGYPIYNILLDWYNEAVIISTGWGGVLKSQDQGKTWEKIAELPAKAGRIYMDQEDSRALWYVTPTEGIFKTQDGGYSWEEIALASLSQYEGGATIYQLEIDREGGTFYLATQYGLLLSFDQGKTWQPIRTLTPFQAIPFYAVAVNPQNSQEILFAAGNTLYKSVNQGESWRVRRVYTGNIIRQIKYHPENPEIIYLGIREIK